MDSLNRQLIQSGISAISRTAAQNYTVHIEKHLSILGKRAGLPLYQLLGGRARRAVDTYRHASGDDFKEVEDRVRQYMHNLSPIGPRDGALFNHMKLQPVIHIAPDGMSAQMRARLFVMFGIYQTDAQWGSGIYEDQLVKVDGKWKFAHRTVK